MFVYLIKMMKVCPCEVPVIAYKPRGKVVFSLFLKTSRLFDQTTEGLRSLRDLDPPAPVSCPAPVRDESLNEMNQT